MNCKYCALLSLAVLALAVVPIQSSSDASDPSTYYYMSALDDVERSIYDQVLEDIQGAGYSDSVDIVVDIVSDVAFRDADPDAARSIAVSYGEVAVGRVLTAMYLSEPGAIWLWDYPVNKPAVTVVPVQVALSDVSVTTFVSGSASFTLTVPEEFLGKVQETLAAVDTAVKAFSAGSGPEYTVRSVHRALGSVKHVDDAEGTVSNVYDALVVKESSSVGVAMAFTYVCMDKSIQAVTVTGYAYDSASDATGVPSMWNAAKVSDSWYLVDATLKDCVLSGYAASVGGTLSVIRVAEAGAFGMDAIDVPDMSRTSFQFPDERNFMEKHGTQVILLCIGVLIVGAVFIGIRRGAL